MQLLQKQFVNDFDKNLNTRQQNFICCILRPLSKNIGNMHSSLVNLLIFLPANDNENNNDEQNNNINKPFSLKERRGLLKK